MSDHEFDRSVVQQFLDLFVVPEIQRRREEGAEHPLHLHLAQIIFYPDGRLNEVRLNDEVNIRVKVKLRGDLQRNSTVGDSVEWSDIESFERMELTEGDDPNCGHATLFHHNGGWHVSFDFRYNKELSRSHLLAAKQFLSAAQHAKDNQYWAVFIDVLCSASELTAKAFLLGMPGEGIINARSHDAVKTQANWHRKLGNLPDTYVGSLNRVWGLRNPASVVLHSVWNLTDYWRG